MIALALLLVAPPPNVVLILADDLGLGDVRAFNPAGKIPTPRLDALAAGGLRFTDAHSPSAVCTPTRYGLLTGRYCWRTPLKKGVLGGLSPRLIEPGRPTLADLLKGRGYATACVGKWHLGLDWQVLPGKQVTRLGVETPQQVRSVDYARPFAGGPLSVGFDRFFGLAASLDMVPYTFLRDDRVAAAPTEDCDFPMTVGKAARSRRGPAAPGFEASDVLPALVTEAKAVIAAAGGKPFFLYLPLASPHTPVVPSKGWAGKSGINPYADFVMETDAAVGDMLGELDRRGLAGNTVVAFTSDNGCSPQADLPGLRAAGHDPCRGFRGAKADIYEGGHRVPLVVRWPGVVPPGETDKLACLTDLYRTIAVAGGAAVPAAAGEDSFDLSPVWRDGKPARADVVHHSIDGSFAIRAGNWKLCRCPGSGGWSEPKPGAAGLPPVQLFDLTADPAETTNRAADRPDVVERLTALLDKQAVAGRSAQWPP